MALNDRTTVRLFGNQPEMLHVLKKEFGTSSASVMRIALERLFEESITKNSCEPSFVIQMHQMLSSWLGSYGFSNNLGSSLCNVTPEIGGIPKKFTSFRGDFDDN